MLQKFPYYAQNYAQLNSNFALKNCILYVLLRVFGVFVNAL